MKYIIGYTNLETVVGTILIPKKVYTEEEKARGKKNYTAISEEDLKSLRTNKVFNSLEEGKKLRVLDKLPGWAAAGGERETQLQAQNKALEDELKKKDSEKQAIVDEATSTIEDLRKENEQLKAQLAAVPKE